ncbi:MAG: hypothetical protein WC770_04980 [Phycisphaerae bacterium]|jgi:hypothetical protein
MNFNENTNIEKNSTILLHKKNCRLAIYSLLSVIAAIVFMALSSPVMLFAHNRILEGVLTLAALLFSHIAFLLGIIAIVVIAISHGKLKGDWYALLAIFLSLPFVFLMASGIYVNKIRVERKKTTNGQIISMAIVEYAKDHDGYLPDANQWCDLLIEYAPNLSKENFKYDSSKDGVCNYAFNSVLSNAKLANISYNTVLVFESVGKWNLDGTEELFRNTPRKRQYVYIYTKDVETGYAFPREVNIKETDYEKALWILSNTN